MPSAPSSPAGAIRAWLRAAGGSPVTALAGKLAPIFAIFMLLMVVLLLIIHGAYEIRSAAAR
jgi:hypothetical protein